MDSTALGNLPMQGVKWIEDRGGPMEKPVPFRRSALFGVLFLSLDCVSFALITEEGSPQEPAGVATSPRAAGYLGQPVSEADFLSAIQRVENLARDLETGPKIYREHLQQALYKLGYGPHHPLFRTSLNGFEQDEIDLEDADAFKMGSFAFSLKSTGQPLTPDPFDDWPAVQNRLDNFQPTLDASRRVASQTDVFAAGSTQNIRLDVFNKLRKRWRAAVIRAIEAYEHALAVRAVQYKDGAMVPAPQTLRFIYEGGRYAAICPSSGCINQRPTGSVDNANSTLEPH